MTRTREENAADIANSEGLKTNAREFFDKTFLGARYFRGIIHETGLDEISWSARVAEEISDNGGRVDGDCATLKNGTQISINDLYDLMEDHQIKYAEKIQSDLSRVFGSPVAETDNGAWYLVDSQEKAEMARDLTETAIDRFWAMTQRYIENDPVIRTHEWLVLVNEMGRGVVAMAAMPEGEPSQFPDFVAECHVTGFQNYEAWKEYEADIRSVAQTRGLTVYPNRMGRRIESSEDTPSP